jgi:hypothetical protein
MRHYTQATYVGPRRELRGQTADVVTKGPVALAQFDRVDDYDLGLPRWAFGRHRMRRADFRVGLRCAYARRHAMDFRKSMPRRIP